ncbi:MAG: RHS repeat-associated core domain-containing protein [Nitrospirota bacterium]
MNKKISIMVLYIFLIFSMFPLTAYAIPGDADGNSVVDMEDARTITRYVVNQISAIPNPADADANQDGKIDMEDAFIIAKKVSGQTRIVMVSALNGSSDILKQGSIIRIEVFEKFFPFNITGGTVRIHSVSTGYDSDDQPLTFERDGRSLYYHWNTAGLAVASDYAITVNLTGPSASTLKTAKSSSMLQAASQPDAIASLSDEIFKPRFLADVIDAFCPAPGMPLEFRRHVPNNAPAYPYLGPLGRGWFHSYDLKLEEFTDGRIALRSRIFQSNSDGTYQSAPGDYGVLTRNPDGTFQLKEKSGFIYRFRSDLRLDYEQDLNGNRITAVYNGSNQLIQIQHSSGKSFSMAYNTAGRIISLTDHAGRKTTYEYEYDATDLMLTRVTDPTGNVTEYTYIMGTPYILGLRLVCTGTCQPNMLDYRLQSISFPDGTRVQNDFDTQARLTRQTGAWGANPITYSYDADGTTHITDSLGATTTVKVNDRSQPLQVTTPDGAQTTFQYDASANLAQVTDPLSHITHFSYDGVSNVTQVTNPLSQTVHLAYDLRFNKPSSITNPLGKTTSFAFDSKGNLSSATYPDGNSEGYDYDAAGNLISSTDASGKMTLYSYNAQGQMTALQNALGNSTQFFYNTAGGLQNVTDAKGHVISHTRDTLGRLTRRTYPDSSHEDYEYDGAGKVTAFTNRRGERISFSYDVTGRLEWKTYPSGKKLHFLYDGAGYLASVEQVVDSTTTLDTAYERDALHRITKAKVPGKVYPESYDVSYSYDAAGNRTFMAHPDGYSLNYSYDAANRLTRISDASNATIVAYEYDAAGRRTKKTLGNGTYTTYQYDDLDRLTLLVNHAPGGAVQSQFGYTYNTAGMRTSMTTLEGMHNYTYDNTYQLTGVSYPDGKTVNYDFDEVGNRKSITDNGALTIYSSNTLDQYTQAGTETFGYDANGNLTTRTLNSATTAYGWDEDDRLVSVDRNGKHIDYHYNYQGRLVAKTIGGQVIRYVWDGFDPIAEMDSDGTVTKRYIYGATIDEIVLVIANGTKYLPQQDGLGSVVGVTNDSGTIVMTVAYDVYGNIRSGALGPVPQRFAGMRWDEDAGLYYVRARWYDSLTGRFLSCDPVSLMDGRSIYDYAENNPLNFIDPLGLDSGQSRQLMNEYLQLERQREVFSKMNLTSKYISTGFGILGNAATLLNPAVGMPWRLAGVVLSEVGSALWEGIAEFITGGTIRMIDLRESEIREQIFQMKHATEKDQIPQYNAERYRDPFQSYLPSREDIINRTLDRWEAIETALNYWSGGTCPTFIQGGQLREERLDSSKDALIAGIKVPWIDSLLRSDIPIYGIASGKDFSRYRIEYGEGMNPATWHLIEESDKPQEKAPDFKDISWMQGDLDLKGDLATWNTGLKNWIHLPWHPQEDTTDLNGIYTLRLTVYGKNGEKAEDKIQVEVGRAIAQSLSGVAISPDKRVLMRFPEQALTHPFRVYTILPLSDVGEKIPELCNGCRAVGDVYRIREAGDRFIEDVSLEFTESEAGVKQFNVENIGISQYDTVRNEWVMLKTMFDRDAAVYRTTLTELPKPKAIYALIYKPSETLSSISQPSPKVSTLTPAKPQRPGVLVENTFENDFGTFGERDRLVGATLMRDKQATPDGSYCLKFENKNFGGNFSATVFDKPFDIRQHGTMTFDYRIGPGTKVDFFLKVNGRWYDLRFTGDPIDFKYRDVNIANLGAIEGIIADDKWHTASVDLRYLLRQQTRNTQVDEIVMANWDVGGYMKLEFGRNPRGAAYYIDNFRITGSGEIADTPATLLVDDFNADKGKNNLGGASGTYTNPGTRYVETAIVEIPSILASTSKSFSRNKALAFNFDTTTPDSYGGYWTSISGTDLSDYSTIDFRLYSGNKVPNVIIGVRSKQGVEGRVSIVPYVSATADSWRDVRIPLTALAGLTDFSSPDVLFFAVSHKDVSGKDSIKIDDLRFQRQPYPVITDFEYSNDRDPLGGHYSTYQNGAASISSTIMKDMQQGSSNMLRISYGGNIGLDYGPNGGFSYALWRAALNGIDARQFRYLVMRIRGEKGGETPNIYLSDPVRRYPLRAKEIPALTKEWQTVKLPLEFYVKHGVDLSRLESLEMVFEWAEQSGTIYVDDVRLE